MTSRDVALGDDGFDDDDGFDFVDRFLEEKRTNERGGVTNSKNKQVGRSDTRIFPLYFFFRISHDESRLVDLHRCRCVMYGGVE